MEKSIVPSKIRLSARDKVLDASVRLFSEVGYFRTSVPDIVRVSGVSIGSIYHHFKDKQGIAVALYNELTKRVGDDLERIESEHETTKNQCRAVIEFLFELTEKEPHTMEFMIYSKHREFLPDHMPICPSKPMARLRELVALGIDRGEIRDMDPFVAASAIYGATFRVIQLRLDGLIPMPITYYLDEVWECSWRSITPDVVPTNEL